MTPTVALSTASRETTTDVSPIRGPLTAIALECRGLTKHFGGVRAVDRVDATFESGKVTALVGPNGAGKTTLFHLITGALKPDEGKILLRRKAINGLPPWKVANLGVGRLFQDVRVFPKLTVLENLLVACRPQAGERVVPALFRRSKVMEEERRHGDEVRRWLDLVGLTSHETSPAEALSYGQQKLLAIARLLAANAEFLLLDEPTAGVNPQFIDRLLAVIRQLAGDGKTVVMIEHNMDVVLNVAEWVYFMDEGQITTFGSPRDVFDNACIRERYLGL